MIFSRTAVACSIIAVALVSMPASGLCGEIALAKPHLKGELSLEEAMARRRSVREFSKKPIDIVQVSQLMWAAQGITGEGGKRTAPSAGALYPLSIYLVAGKVDGLLPGIYRYQPRDHSLVKVKGADQREGLAAAAGGQRSVRSAPASIVIAVNYHRMDLYHPRGEMFADMEQGHAAQNVLLEATALGLGAVPVGSMKEADAAKLLDLPSELSARYLIPVGYPK